MNTYHEETICEALNNQEQIDMLAGNKLCACVFMYYVHYIVIMFATERSTLIKVINLKEHDLGTMYGEIIKDWENIIV